MRFYGKRPAWLNNGKSGNKLHAEKAVVDNIIFDSKREAKRYCELKLLLKAGEISHLELQKEFILLPPQYDKPTGFYQKGEKKGQPKQGKLLERGVSYFADFCYIDTKTNDYIVEDTKGYRDPSSSEYAKFVLKRKMLLYFYGIKIREI